MHVEENCSQHAALECPFSRDLHFCFGLGGCRLLDFWADTDFDNCFFKVVGLFSLGGIMTDNNGVLWFVFVCIKIPFSILYTVKEGGFAI